MIEMKLELSHFTVAKWVPLVHLKKCISCKGKYSVQEVCASCVQEEIARLNGEIMCDRLLIAIVDVAYKTEVSVLSLL